MAEVCYLYCIVFVISAVTAKLIREPELTEAVAGSPVMLHCQTDIRDKEHPVEWRFHADSQVYTFTIIYKMGKLLNGYQDKAEVSPDPSTGTYDLKILNVSLSDAGFYTCEDDHSRQTAELIVIERYPSDQFCSLTTPTDCVLGKNKCSIESDPIRMSCQLRYKSSTELYLEWRNGQRLINASMERDADGVTTSTIQVRADQIQPGNFSCRLKYRNQMVSSIVWTTTVNVTTIFDSDVATEGDCDVDGTKCPLFGSPIDSRCEYVWTDTKSSVVAKGAYLDLTHLPSDNYTCLATCSIRQTSCSLVAETFVYRCNKTETSEPPPKSEELTNLLLIVSIVALPAGIAVGIAIFLMKRRFSQQTKVSDEKEKQNMMPKEVKPGVQSV